MEQLQVTDLQVEFGGLRAVDGLSFSVKEGEILCLLGPNGAGKSTTLDLICGKTHPTGGSIQLNGVEISQMLEFRRARLGIGRKFQVPSVYKNLTVDENLSVARSRRPGMWSALSRFALSDARETAGILDRIQLGAKRNELAGNLSHGETQWLEIAMLIAQDSKLILMDEPTAGMTIQETERTAEIFRSLSNNHTLIVVEHDMSFVRTVADRIIVMNRGAMLAEGSIEEIEANEDVKTAYLGH
ncbi:Lipopolysaccharide export system ATP-binding protein LptB [Thalassovita gelatinovora]|uniref:Lipopolysaccharide export system ATP-binding protein LptB n=1 Tax=Thalassovita gelatinovora TaxID=53501 RepID=A0A0P1FIS7_THAGE|nr:urea ABC transporter ATP-binding protein UrtD [Thalassovita gelatinovora]QIZ82010.1 urea ABC transporter ATP-binding protein UrtD [Thalassovita gelatinovora]CUH67469.1 Lipopolysaccharide export system ATP-binding protein LptB [Thalassovita gelatinovora]SEP73407.1 urea transport system ATP-binding protein [Thalassovita gelatinovora]